MSGTLTRLLAGLSLLLCAIIAACTDAPVEPVPATSPAAEQADASTLPQSSGEEAGDAELADDEERPAREQSAAPPPAGEGGDRASDQGEAEEETAAEPEEPRLADVKIDFEIAVAGGRRFRQPTDLFVDRAGLFAGEEVGLFVAEQEGTVTRFSLNPAKEDSEVVLSLPVQVAFEEGLLSIWRDSNTIDPFRLYAWYTPEGGRRTRLSRFQIGPGGTSELVILEVPQPYPNHNGGAIRFGPDGMLYLGIGDGGAAGDPLGSGQDRSTLLGSIIRIDVSEASPAEPYRIPPDNPFVGDPEARPEIWAYGFRNPWRMAFDSSTGDLWVADVGQNSQEEVGIVRRGENHGWNVYEGDSCFNRNPQCGVLEAVAPIATYGRRDGCSVSGGIVDRGSRIPGLYGAFIYGDYCTGKIWAARADGEVAELADTDWPIVSMGKDGEAGILIIAQGQPIRRIIPAGD